MTKDANNDLRSRGKNVHSCSIEDILSLELTTYPHPIAVSPDGKRLAIAVQSHRRRQSKVGQSEKFLSTGFSIYLEGSEIFLVDLKSGEHRNLTPNWGTSYRPVWSPDGAQLAFYSDRNGKAQLWIWEGSAAEPRPACDVRIRPFLHDDVPPRWTPDGTRIVVKLAPETEITEKPESKNNVSVRLFSSQPEAKDDVEDVFMPSWADDWFRADIGVVTIATGEVRRFDQKFHPFGLIVSPDGTMAAVMDFLGHETVKGTQSLSDLYLLPLDENPPRCLAQRLHGGGLAFSWSPDGRYLAYATEGSSALGELFIISTVDGSQSNLTENTDVRLSNSSQPPLWSSDSQYLFCVAERHLWRVSVAEKSVKKLTEGFDRNVVRIVRREEAQTVWSPDGEHSIYIQTFHPKNKQHGFHRVNLINREITPLVEENRLYHSGRNLDVAPETGDTFYLVEDITHPADVWMADKNFQNRRQVTRLNPKIETMNFGEVRLIDWKTPFGKHLHGLVLLPANYVDGQRYPLVTKVYGGALFSNWIHNFGTDSSPVDNMYLLTNHGYAVFLPDTPMKTNDPIRELADAVLSGIDAVIEMGIADANRLGLMGDSYGGYCVNALITQTSRFRAAVSSAPISNLISMYGFLMESGDSPWIGWAETHQGRMGGSLWEFRDRYIENSPIFFLDKVETPLLLVVGGEDAALVAQAGEIFSGLRRLGKKVVLARYDGEGHWRGTWRYPNAVDCWQRVLAWFDEFLLH